MKTTLKVACSFCGSTRSAKSGDRCRSLTGCEARQREKRLADDGKRGGRQCPCTTGRGSIRFCLLREGHAGTHMNGSVEWGGRESHPLATALLGSP
jgi:hypothetical protein